ncbi:hypothetical protein AHAS_Ahas13G0299500 [Arachis hypogaea]
MQGNMDQIREQQGQFNWGEMQVSLSKIMEQQMVQQRNLAEFRSLYEAKTTSRRQYDINTQAKLNHLCNAVATLNLNYPTFMQGMEELSAKQEKILAKHKEDERTFMRRLGFWKTKDTQEQEGASTKRNGDESSKKKDKRKGPMH